LFFAFIFFKSKEQFFIENSVKKGIIQSTLNYFNYFCNAVSVLDLPQKNGVIFSAKSFNFKNNV